MSRISLGISVSIVATVIACGGIASFFLPVSGVWAVTDQASMVLHFFEGRVRVFWVTSDRQEIVVRRSPVGGPDLWVEKRPGDIKKVSNATLQPTRRLGSDEPPQDRDNPGGSMATGERSASDDGPPTPDSNGLDADPASSRAATSVSPLGPWWARRPGAGQRRWRPPQDFLFQIAIGSRSAVPPFGGQWRKAAMVPQSITGTVEVSFVRMPVWLPVVVLLLQPIRAIVFGPWLWRRRERRNQCQACGYERMGLTEPRCPECGTPHGAADRSISSATGRRC